MENLPAPTPNRQWFRLASLARMEALGQNPDTNPLTSTSAAPALVPTSAALRPPSPALAPASAALRPPSPAPLPSPTNPRLQPNEPPQPQSSPTKNASGLQPTAGAAAVPDARTPPLGLPTVRIPSRLLTPPQSPKIISASTPNPSESLRVPRQLQPHPEPEPEPKMPPLPKLSSSSVNGKMQEDSSQSSSAKEQTATSSIRKNKSAENNNSNQAKVITMAGDNTGAYFELLPARRGGSGAKKEEEHKGKMIGESNHVGVKKEEPKHKRSVVNSNVQSVNNSILFGTSCTIRSPGVHLAFVGCRQPKHKGGDE